MKDRVHNLSPVNRTGRVLLGATLIGSTLAAEGALGWTALLPLIAVAPLLTAILGYCPIVAGSNSIRQQRRTHTIAPLSAATRPAI